MKQIRNLPYVLRISSGLTVTMVFPRVQTMDSIYNPDLLQSVVGWILREVEFPIPVVLSA